MHTAFGRPYPAPAVEPRAVTAWQLNRRDTGRLSLFLVGAYAVASFAILAAGLVQGA